MARVKKSKMALAPIVFAMALLFIAPAFAISTEGGEFSINSTDAGGGSVSNSDYQLDVFSDALQGEVSGSGYILSVGSMEYFLEEEEVSVSDLKQDTSTPQIGGSVNISTSVSAPAGLSYAILYTNETGNFLEYERRNLTGTSANISFSWNKSVPAGTVIGWKMRVYDVNGNFYETPIFTFVVGVEDLNPPSVSSLTNYPVQPAIGEIVQFVADVEDDYGLASAVLEVDGKNVSVANLIGKTWKALFNFKPEGSAGQQISWRVFAGDSSGKGVVSETKTFTLLAEVPSERKCNETEKPKPVEMPCVDGKKKFYTVACNATTEKWGISTREGSCLELPQFLSGKDSGLLLAILGIVLLIIIISVVYLYKKYPEKFRKFFGKTNEAAPIPPS